MKTEMTDHELRLTLFCVCLHARIQSDDGVQGWTHDDVAADALEQAEAAVQVWKQSIPAEAS